MLTDVNRRFLSDFNCFSLTKHTCSVYLDSATDYQHSLLCLLFYCSSNKNLGLPSITKQNTALNNTAGILLSKWLFTYLAKLIASSGSWTSSSSKCLSAIDCIFIRLCFVACCSVIISGTDSSPCRRRDCTDSKNSVYKLFLSASKLGNTFHGETLFQKITSPPLKKNCGIQYFLDIFQQTTFWPLFMKVLKYIVRTKYCQIRRSNA